MFYIYIYPTIAQFQHGPLYKTWAGSCYHQNVSVGITSGVNRLFADYNGDRVFHFNS